MFTLRMAEHLTKEDINIVEIWYEGKFMGTIYPTETGVKLVSKRFPEDPKRVIEIEQDKLPPIPAILIHFKRP